MSPSVRLSSLLLSALAVAAFAGCSQSSNNASTAQNQASPSSASPSASLAHVRGTITAVTPSLLTVTTDQGTVAVAISPSTGVVGVVPGKTSDIKPNTFIGSANVPGTGAARALEVVVFPDSMRGTGEGNYAWDLPANGGSTSMMTNGTVGRTHASQGSMMTNGTVGSTHASQGSMMTNGAISHASTSGPLTLTVNYKGGSTQITVPPNTPIVRIVPGDHSLLTPGAHVFAVAKGPSGHLAAVRLIVGEHGTIPPM